MLTNVVGQFNAAYRAHHHVGHHGVRIEFFRDFDGSFGTIGGYRMVSGCGQDLDKTVGDPNIVIDNQNTKALMSVSHGDPDLLVCLSSIEIKSWLSPESALDIRAHSLV